MGGAEAAIRVRFHRVAASALGVVLAAAVLLMAGCVPPPPTAPMARPQLDSLVAPIALYPDPLLAQILMAATYPDEVTDAAAWRQDPANASLSGPSLATVSATLPWDPSVKALLQFPEVLEWMAANPQWLQQLGNSFIVQQAEMASGVQRLRHLALAAGTLKPTPQQTVTVAGDIITIAPTAPQTVYMPIYNPARIYRTWPYPEAPPYQLPPPRGYAFGAGISFGVADGVVDALWGWNSWNWQERYIRIDRVRYNQISNGHGLAGSDVWMHGYHNQAVAQRLTPPPGPAARQGFRGFGGEASIEPRTPLAFQSFGRGSEVRLAAARGMASRTSARAPMHAVASPSGSSRTAHQ
jgi:hypothetical protein